DDVGTFISPGKKVLYFASASHGAGRQGGVDIYQSARLDESWDKREEPVDLGKTINTSALDFYFTIDKEGNAYTSRANKALDGAQLDIYALVPKTININLRGVVLNEKTNEPVQSDIQIDIRDTDPIKLRTKAGGDFETKFRET